MSTDTEVGKRFPPTVKNFYAGMSHGLAWDGVVLNCDFYKRRSVESAIMAPA